MKGEIVMKEPIVCSICNKPIVTDGQCIKGYWIHNNCIVNIIESKIVKTCCICGKVLHSPWDENNPRPYKDSGVCCGDCNTTYVIPERMGIHIDFIR